MVTSRCKHYINLAIFWCSFAPEKLLLICDGAIFLWNLWADWADRSVNVTVANVWFPIRCMQSVAFLFCWWFYHTCVRGMQNLTLKSQCGPHGETWFTQKCRHASIMKASWTACPQNVLFCFIHKRSTSDWHQTTTRTCGFHPFSYTTRYISSILGAPPDILNVLLGFSPQLESTLRWPRQRWPPYWFMCRVSQPHIW